MTMPHVQVNHQYLVGGGGTVTYLMTLSDPEPGTTMSRCKTSPHYMGWERINVMFQITILSDGHMCQEKEYTIRLIVAL